MKIAVIGAAGRTGRQVVGEALARGHGVIAVVRAPEKLGLAHDGLAVARADVTDRGALAEAVQGADALISALGTGSSRDATTVYSSGVANELDAMRAHGIARLVVISAAPVGPRAEQARFERRLAMPLLERFFGGIYADMRRMEAILADSDCSWVSLRPPPPCRPAGEGRIPDRHQAAAQGADAHLCRSRGRPARLPGPRGARPPRRVRRQLTPRRPLSSARSRRWSA
jgi:putative NADH-flavin reductase